MNKTTIKILIMFVYFFLYTERPVSAQEGDIPRNLVDFVQKKLISVGTEQPVISLVSAQNEKDFSLTGIRKRDEIWKKTPGLDRYMLDLMSNDCALALFNTEYRYPFIVRSFVMDNQGANIGLTAKTSDYWYGDNDNFLRSYNHGVGAVHYGEVKIDDNTNEIIVQVSVPVVSQQETIGAITFCISLDRWERR